MSSRRRFLGSVGAGLAGGAMAGARSDGVSASPWPAAGAAASPSDPVDWKAVEAQFDIDPAQVFFNTGTLGSCPRPVRERVIETLRRLDTLPTFEYWGRCMPRFIELLAKSSGLLGAGDPASVTITHSTTEGMNIVARGLRLQAGDEVVTTNHEHVGGESILKHLERTAGIRVKRYAMPFRPPSDAEIVAGIRDLITPRTRLLMVSHVLYTNALIMPVEALGRLSRERGVRYLVDGAHPVGQMRVDVRRIDCDFYAASGHKWLCGPRGTGFLYVRPSLLATLDPLIVSYDPAHPPKDARHFDAGATRLNFAWTNNIHDMMGLEAAIDFHEALGPERVRARCMELIRRFHEGVSLIPGLEPVPIPEERSAPMLTVKVAGRTNTSLFQALKKLGITVKEVADEELPEPINSIRVACHVFNSERQVDRLLAGLRQAMEQPA